MLRALLFLLLLPSVLIAAEIPDTAYEHTLVEVTLSVKETATVKSYRIEDPLGTGLLKDAVIVVETVDTFTALDESGMMKTCVFTGPPGSYTVDVFGGETPVSKTCTIVRKGPAPTPVDPVTPPKPVDPVTPDIPATVLNQLGVGGVAYTQAVVLNDKATASRLASLMKTMETYLHQGRKLPADAKLAIADVPANWKPWATAVQAKINQVAMGRDNGTSIIAYKNYIHEIQSALSEVAK